MLHDFRYAVRRLRNSPGYSTIAIVTIALAVGANTAMFSLLEGLFLRPLPYPEPDRIVRVLEKRPDGGVNAISTLNYLDWTNQSTAFDYLAAEAGWRATLTGGPEPVSIRAALVSGQYFDIFGVRPSHGRTFTSGDGEPGKDRVVLLSHRLWLRQFGADPALVGRDIVLNGEPHTVIGILPADGPFDRTATQIWKPLAFTPAHRTRDFRWLGASGRLKAGVTLEQARTEMDLIAQRIAASHPPSNKGWGVAVDRLADVLVSEGVRAAVVVLFGATAVVVLIGCANLANLALARGLARRSEMAVRAALGATPRHLVWAPLLESVVISVCGGIAAAIVGDLILRLFLWWNPPYSLPPAVHIEMDATVLTFTLIVALGCGLLFGLAPAMQALRPDLAGALKERSDTSGPGIGSRIRGVLVVSEITLAFVLLVASGLLMRSVINLLHIDPGFDATNVLTSGLPLTPGEHRTPDDVTAYLDSIREAVAAVPGVRTVAMASALPLQGGGYGVPYAIADREALEKANRRRAFLKIISPSYIDALGIKLLAGRPLTDGDTAGAPPVALVNETFARREFPDEDPVGRRILVQKIVPGTNQLGSEVAWEIVGVVAGERTTGLGDPVGAGIYVSNRQNPTFDVHLIVRADIPPEPLTTAVQSAVARVSRGQAVSEVATLEQIVRQSTVGNRVVGTLVALFAAAALLLAAVGIYGVVDAMTSRREHELGIRAALGARPAHLRKLIVEGALKMTLIGLAVGLVVTVPATQAMAPILYRVEADDPFTMSVVAALILGVVALACVRPVRRITRRAPIEAIRSR